MHLLKMMMEHLDEQWGLFCMCMQNKCLMDHILTMSCIIIHTVVTALHDYFVRGTQIYTFQIHLQTTCLQVYLLDVARLHLLDIDVTRQQAFIRVVC